MRRIATAAALVAPLCLSGCGSIAAPWSRTTRPIPGAHPLEPHEVRTARDIVPDSAMLPDQARGGYRDSPAGP